VIFVGPGPGSPEIPADIGVVKDLWHLPESELLPIFGVCLGLQSFGVEHGAQLRRLQVVKHGQRSKIIHHRSDIFAGVDEIQAVRYHSLYIVAPGDGHIQELAWADDGLENGRVVMGVRHKTKPFWGVQYHPESVCTDGGFQVLLNFWRLAQRWSEKQGRYPVPWIAEAGSTFGAPWPPLRRRILSQEMAPAVPPARVTSKKIQVDHLNMVNLSEFFGAQGDSPFLLLESAANPGRFSILAALTPDSTKLMYSLSDSTLRIFRGQTEKSIHLASSELWAWLSEFMKKHKVSAGPTGVPFWGGLAGILSYEFGVQGLGVGVDLGRSGDQHPDVNLVFVERSIIVDHHAQCVYVQSLLPDDQKWIDTVCSEIQEFSGQANEPVTKNSTRISVVLPEKDRYISQIKLAKECLFAGESYELCLTARTRIKTAKRHSWDRYKVLRKTNPAPHSAYIRLYPTTFMSSSPERFLSYSRPPTSRCQLRPIKGTVRKGPGITREVAEEALIGSPKEVAENLMIVDLIRHDLHSVVGEDVCVKQFCSVEEYETVYQLVSVIEGGPSSASMDDSDSQIGWKVLQSSLPPGSMTGAPKKRSVEILQSLEDDKRGLYSGVFGYWCVGGGGDWSVTIRTAFKYDGEDTSECDKPDEEWVVGAGGAITALSDPEAEWDEMMVKLKSVLRSFEAM
jgi:para-aminobenzoate synthetase